MAFRFEEPCYQIILCHIRIKKELELEEQKKQQKKNKTTTHLSDDWRKLARIPGRKMHVVGYLRAAVTALLGNTAEN